MAPNLLNETARVLFARSRRAMKPENKDPYDLSNLEAGTEYKSINSTKAFYLATESKTYLVEILGSLPNQLSELQILLRPVALIVIPSLWIIYRLYWNGGEKLVWSFATFSLKTAFNLLLILSISIVFLVCTLLAKEYFSSRSKANMLQTIRSNFTDTLEGTGTEVLSQIAAFLKDERCRMFATTTFSAIQKIAYKSKSKNLHLRVQRFPNGDMYQGESFEGKNCGNGVYTFHMKGKYEGEWVDGNFEGYGIESCDAVSRYKGQYRRGVRDGYGVYKFDDGEEYSGEWVDGKSHGYGVQNRCSNGSKYIGEFRGGFKHGLGLYYFGNGDTYSGEYAEDKFQGYGVYRFGEGHMYEGAWHEGNKDGLGIYTKKDGEVHAGLWRADALPPSTTFAHSSPPNSMSAITPTKLWNAVQEARRAARKAMELPRVGEQVNKAVKMANSAANRARLAALKARQDQKNFVAAPDLDV